jgi:cell wall-associated NlpC family hydrolase
VLRLSFRALGTTAFGFALVAAVLPTAAGATPTASPPGEIHGLQAQASALSEKITAESEQEQIAAEHYDDANTEFASANARLVKIRATLTTERRRAVAAQRHVRETAVAAYVLGDSAAAEVGTILTTSVNDQATMSAYAGVATSNLQHAVVQLQGAEKTLQLSESQQLATVQAANEALHTSQTARTEAANLAATSQATLSQVKGHLAQVMIQQEEAAAAAAAARARAAKQARERIAAEEQASADASVVDIVDGNSSNPSSIAAVNTINAIANDVGSLGNPPLQEAGTTPAGNIAVATAESFLGDPYLWGGASTSGMDCSGMTLLAWGAAGVPLTHSAYYQYRESTPVSLTALEPGDLLFYYFPNDGSDPVTHVAMYVGQGPYGTQTIIQAPETGLNVEYVPMYYGGLVGAGRPTA